jgi:hypothetical protein
MKMGNGEMERENGESKVENELGETGWRGL